MHARWPGLLAVCALAPALAVGQTDSATVRQGLLTENLLFAAMEMADTSAGQLLTADLTYTNEEGEQNTRADFLRILSSGTLKYRVIWPDARDVRVYGTIALVVGLARMRVESAGQSHFFRIRYLAVYRRGGTQGWELMAWQSTRLPT